MNRTHGLSGTRQYKAYQEMKNRCCRATNKDFGSYGGRGIAVCDRWQSFEAFWEDMQEGYADNLTLDRIDVNGNYEKSNCRWATSKQQCNNRRNNRLLIYEGQQHTFSEMARLHGMNRHQLYDRLISGWSLEKALKTPIKQRRNNKNEGYGNCSSS